MTTSSCFLRFGTWLSSPAWQRLALILLPIMLLATLTWWAINE